MTALVARCRAAAEDRRPPAARRTRSSTPCRPICAGPDADGAGDLIGMKWVAGFATNNDAGAAGDQRGRRHQRRRDGAADRDPRRRTDHGAPDGGRLGRRDPALRSDRDGARATGGAHRRGGPGPQPPRRPRAGAAGRRADPVRPAPGARGGARRRRRRPTDGIGDGHRGAGRALRRARRRRRRDRGLVRAGPPGDDRRLAGPGCARRAGRLRDVLRGRGRPRRGALPRRRPRPVPGQPGRRPVRRLPRPDGHARRGDPGRHAAARRRVGSSRRISGSAWPTSCSAPRSSSAPRHSAWERSSRADGRPRRTAATRTGADEDADRAPH